jgi:hypothetical protein
MAARAQRKPPVELILVTDLVRLREAATRIRARLAEVCAVRAGAGRMTGPAQTDLEEAIQDRAGSLNLPTEIDTIHWQLDEARDLEAVREIKDRAEALRVWLPPRDGQIDVRQIADMTATLIG